MVDTIVYCLKTVMNHMGYRFILGYAPADRPEALTVDTNMDEKDPASNQFFEAVGRKSVLTNDNPPEDMKVKSPHRI